MSSPRLARARHWVLALSSALLFAAISLPAVARAKDTNGDHAKKMKMSYGEFAKMDPAECMKMMDTAHKGYVTKKEFLKFQEQLFNNIPKKTPDRVTQEEWDRQYHTGP